MSGGNDMKKILKFMTFVFAAFILLGISKVKAEEIQIYLSYIGLEGDNGQATPITVDTEATVEELKTKAKGILGLEPNEQVIQTFAMKLNGEMLQDDKKLSDYNITLNGYTLSVRKLVKDEVNHTFKCDKNIKDIEFYVCDEYAKYQYEAKISDPIALHLTSIKKNGDNVIATGYSVCNYYSNIVFKFESDEDTKAVVSEYLKKLSDEKDTYSINDMEFVAYWINGGTMLYYSKEFMSAIDNKNFELDVRAGYHDPLATGGFGVASFKYNDTVYYFRDWFGAEGEHVLYAPTGTADADLMKAVQERIDKNFGEGKAVLSDCGTLEQMFEEDEVDPDILELSQDGHVYKVTIGENTYYTLLASGTAKMQDVTYSTSDILTDVTISLENAKVPMDTLVNVKKITSGAEYEKILNILKIADNEMFDLKLFTLSTEKYITKFEDGSFEVKIPISEKLAGKDLAVYYVDENEKVETYDVTVVDGYAVFNTSHFSIYTLGEKVANGKNDGEDLPGTGDYMNAKVYAGIITIIAIMGCVVAVYNRKRLNAK